MGTVIAWMLVFWVGNGQGGWQGGYFPDGSMDGTLGKSFAPAPGWSCDYQEATRTNGNRYRYVSCVNKATRVGSEIEIDACDERTPERHARMVLLDFTSPQNAPGKSTGEVAAITLGCSVKKK